MEDILNDLSTPALIRAIKANLLEFFRHLSLADSTEFYVGDRFLRWHTRVPHPWFNGVLVVEPPAAEDEPLLEEHVAYFRAHHVSIFTLWLEPQLSVGAWADFLQPRAFKLDHTTPGMAIDLARLREARNAPTALKIVPVEDLKTLKLWTHVFILGYELPPAWEQDFYELMAGLGLDLPMRNYLGYLQDEPVATSNLFLAAGVAGIQCVATVPQARGRGLGGALTRAPLIEARALGYRVGTLQSSDMGLGIYRQLGFQKLCDMEHFYRATDIDLE